MQGERGRVPFGEAGGAFRQARARAAAAHISPLEWEVLMAVCELTASWSKLTDRTSARRLAAMVYDREPETVTGGQRRRVRDALASLGELGILTITGARGGQNAGVTVTLPNVLRGEHVPPREHVDEDQRAPGAPPTCSVGNNNVLPARGNTEHSSRASLPTAAQDPLALRLAAHLAPKNPKYDYVTCLQTVNQLRAKNIGDVRIDELIGQAIEADAYAPGWLVKAGQRQRGAA